MGAAAAMPNTHHSSSSRTQLAHDVPATIGNRKLLQGGLDGMDGVDGMDGTSNMGGTAGAGVSGGTSGMGGMGSTRDDVMYGKKSFI